MDFDEWEFMNKNKNKKKKPPGPSYCGVPQCKSYGSSTISMHKLPRRVLNNPKELQRWKDALKMGKPFPKYFVMCSLHFEPNKIIVPINRGQLKRTSRLVDTAFPTLNLPKSTIPSKYVNRKYRKITSFDDQPCLSDVSEITEPEFVSPPMSEELPEHTITSSTPSSSSDISRDSSLIHMAVDPLQPYYYSGSESKDPSTALCDYMASELLNLQPEQAAFARSRLRRAFNDIMDSAALMTPHWNEQPDPCSE